MASPTLDFDVYPRQVMSGDGIRCTDKTDYEGFGKRYWIITVDENKPFTVSTPPSTHINIANADTMFAVDELVTLKSSASDLPAGLAALPSIFWVKTVTTTYIELSTTKGGTAVSYTDAGSGTLSVSHACHSQQFLVLKPCPVTTAATYDVTEYFSQGSMDGSSLTKTGLLTVYPTTVIASKPNTSKYGMASIFIYDDTNATSVCRRKLTGNPFFFQKLKVTGSMNKAGTAKFTVVDVGDATATEKGLIVADKNVAIILGHNVIWSGKILRATQGKVASYDTVVPFTSWSVECESDVAKLRFETPASAVKIRYNAPVGKIVSSLIGTTWCGLVEKSYISFEGPRLEYTIGDSDLYSQVVTLSALSGYDWRVRNNYVKYLYGTSKYDSSAKTVTLTSIAPYTASTAPTTSFLGKWLLFTNDLISDGSSNTNGVRAYGKITSNTTTVISMTTINNATLPPASNGNIIILGDPVLDFSSDLRQKDYLCTFYGNRVRAAGTQNAYEVNDKSDFKSLATGIVCKGPSAIPDVWDIYRGLPQNSTTSVTFFANELWLDTKQEFDDCDYITYKTQGYIYSVDTANKYIYLIGHDYALQVNDKISMTYSGFGAVYVTGWYDISALLETTSDGVPLTRVTVTTTPSAYPKYSLAFGNRLYINTGTLALAVSPLYDTVFVGCGYMLLSSASVDATYGLYYPVASPPGSLDVMCPHIPGCIISSTPINISAPDSSSPCGLFGDIMKSFTVDQNTNMSILEIYATNYLLNKSLYYKKASFLSFFYDWFKTELRPTNQVTEAGWLMEGDRISVLQNTADTALDIEYGDYKNQYQILSWSLDTDKMVITCELGDFETNMNTLINDKTTAINTPIT